MPLGYIKKSAASTDQVVIFAFFNKKDAEIKFNGFKDVSHTTGGKKMYSYKSTSSTLGKTGRTLGTMVINLKTLKRSLTLNFDVRANNMRKHNMVYQLQFNKSKKELNYKIIKDEYVD